MSNETRLMSGSLRIAQLDGAFSGADDTAAIYHKQSDGKLYWQMGSAEAKKFISAGDVSGSIAGETTRALAAEAAIQADVDQNESDADAAVAALTASIQNVDSESQAADASLTTRLAAEETARAAAITALQADVDGNESDADAAIAAEASTRGTADTSLTTRVAAEETARAAAITALQADVDQNESDADAAIAAEGTRALAAEASLTTRLAAEEAASANLAGGNSFVGDQLLNGDFTLEEGHSVKAGSFVTYSDATLKTNIANMDGALEKVMSMRGVTYEMKHTAGSAEVGFLAQEMAQTVPEVVYGNGDGNLGIDYAKLTSVLVEAIKSQQEQIEELRATLLNK